MAANQIHILKGRFKALTTNTFGIFIVFIDRTSKNIDKMSIIASHFSSMYDHDPAQSWEKFEDIIAQMRFNGEISTSLSNDFQALFVSSFLTDIVELFIDDFDSKNFSKTEHTIQSLIEKILSEKNISLQLEKETVTKDAIDAVKSERDQSVKASDPAPSSASVQESVTFQVDEGGVVLNVGLVIGPISGIPIYDVKPGDQIVVKIAGRTQKEQYFIDLLGARNESGEVIPVPAVVKEVRSSSSSPKEYNLLVEIGPGIFGKATEQEQVKLKRYDPLLDSRNVKKQAGGNSSSSSSVKFSTSSSASSGKSSSAIYLWLIGGIALLLTVVFLIFLR